jgi:hypothetical protein
MWFVDWKQKQKKQQKRGVFVGCEVGRAAGSPLRDTP